MTLTPFQGSIIGALDKLGYAKKYHIPGCTQYVKDGCPDFEASQIMDEKDLIKMAFENGQTAKTWELQQILGIYGR